MQLPLTFYNKSSFDLAQSPKHMLKISIEKEKLTHYMMMG